ncbi:outer membrane beta-barrel family protein [Flavobacterium granuli]|uniref:Outer membrane receptor for ferrienterochelin and colicin n=1 Tax=Flavobacterium granuli TaxID=280093 RepID=A0A1M5I5V5_9FLAO|nr:outer membrane beta-barrel family protein [Flavobacterium granuli]PRZ27796.1 outer membrane receptor for ferrienterochelin and colicin [Flavobacterium granuli]SHG23429.1 Outer membrane receptor for ferrienterochelin and colicins [Flavobacterium granuli]
MKYQLKYFFSISLLFTFLMSFAQQNAPSKERIKITGTVIEKISKQPLEYATVTFINSKNPKAIAGGITNAKGEFAIDVISGVYDIKIEFISFKLNEIKQKNLQSSTNLGKIALEEDAAQLNEVIIRAEKSTVEIKLDKKVYNVGNDLMVKGGTVSDVLDNIPSVSVDVEGNVSLRGNENVRVLIDGKPSNAINIAEALRLIPADAIDKVEVITNPSARYDAEGGGGLLNIILKKGKNQGLNGTFIASTGIPDNHGLSGTLSYKSKNFNIFTTQGYNYRNSPGSAITNSRYLNSDNTTKNYVNETRENDRYNKGYNGNFGLELYLNESTSWTNILNYRKNKGDNVDDVFQKNYDQNYVYDYTRNRTNEENSDSENVEFSTNFTKKFKKDGHKLTIDGSFSTNNDLNDAIITDKATNSNKVKFDNTINNQDQNRNLIQMDYVLPLGKGSQFEAGYRGDFSKLVTDYRVENDGVINTNFTNTLEYKEKVNAIYTQYGMKINKFSALFGLRFEDSNIDINQLATNDFNTKKYSNFFPSAFFTYEISDESSTSISYSRRISRPRGRMLNPFSNLSSNINIFTGNPDLNPAFTDAIDLGYIKRWDKLTLNTSLYVNKTTDVFQFARRESGDFVNGTPIIISSPINLATEYRAGYEFTLNYSPYKWWKLNGNFNFFRNETQGNFVYTDFNNQEIVQNFDNTTTSWYTRITSKVSLPYKIDWQTNATYNGPQNYAQGRSLGVFAANLAFSKDILKDKGTLSFNISDVFNSRKRMMDSYLAGVVDSYSEMQWRKRQFSLSFTYRINKQKNERERQPKNDNNDNGGDFPG